MAGRQTVTSGAVASCAVLHIPSPAVSISGILTFVNCYNVKVTARLQNVFMVTKVSALILVIVVGIVVLAMGTCCSPFTLLCCLSPILHISCFFDPASAIFIFPALSPQSLFGKVVPEFASDEMRRCL